MGIESLNDLESWVIDKKKLDLCKHKGWAEIRWKEEGVKHRKGKQGQPLMVLLLGRHHSHYSSGADHTAGLQLVADGAGTEGPERNGAAS